MKKKPDEINSWEYLNEHLYQRALHIRPALRPENFRIRRKDSVSEGRGGFEAEFKTCKEHLPALESFHCLKDFIQCVEENRSLKEQVISDIKRLWPGNYNIRPAFGVILLLAMWKDLPQSRLEDFYYDLFVKLSD